MLFSLSRRFLVALLFAGALLLLPRVAHADDGGGQYVGPDTCKACHPEQAKAWTDAPHADASKVTAFVEAWQALKSPGYCLACHTTGYDPNTGLYALEGVTCESCHGPLVQGHPQNPMVVDTSPQACGQCHKSTLNEWEVSRHGQVGIGCVACHDVHGATAKSAIATELCAKCHAEQTASVSHASSAGKGLTCADCHIGPRVGDPTEGHANTGHTFSVGTGTCSRCHSDQVHKGVAAMMGGTPPAEAEPTPTATAPVSAEGGPPSVGAAGVAFPIVASGVAGLVIGVFWVRWQNRRAQAVGNA